MKTLATRALLCALALGATLSSCKKDDGNGKKEDGTVYNKFTVAGESYTTDGGEVEYYADYFNATTSAVDLTLYAGQEAGLYFEMAAPLGNQRLVAGTYNFTSAADANVQPYSFTDSSEAWAGEGGISITAGKVVVSVSGTGNSAVYTIAVDCTLEGGQKATGTYRGTLDWSDESSSQ